MDFYKNLYIKYPDEFLDSIKNSLLSKCLLKLIIFEYKLVLNYIYLITRQALGFLKIKKYFKKT